MIYIVRHGQTVWNKQKRKQGRKDSPLTLLGVKQAIAVADRLSQEDEILNFKWLCSPLFRAWQSCQLATETMGGVIDYSQESQLMEHSFGAWEGLNESEIEEKFPGMVADREASWWTYQVPGGESYELLFQRVSHFLDQRYDGSQKLVLYTHEMVSKMLRAKLLQLSQEESLRLNHPQNVIYKINKGLLTELKTSVN